MEPMERSAKWKMNILGVFSVCLSLSENCKISKTNSIHEIMIGIMIGIMIEIMVEFLTSSLCRVCVPNLEAVGAAVPKTPLELNKANSPTMGPWRFAFCGGASGNGGVGAMVPLRMILIVRFPCFLKRRNGQTYGWMDRPSYRDARTHLKTD